MSKKAKEPVTAPISPRVSSTADSLRHDFERHLRYTLARDRFTATARDRYVALAHTVRDRLIERWIATQQTHHKKNVKRIYYLSLEFLIGRLLGNNVINLKIEDECRAALSQLGLDWNLLRDHEVDAGLGNGGLGRLAACFLDSMSTLNLPAVGYGLRYDFGIFNQKIVNGYQVEQPDDWLKLGNPWEITHPEFSFEVRFNGRVEQREGPHGAEWDWLDGTTVIGMPHDLPVVGYGGRTVNTLRLWSAKATEEFSLDDFNRGSYVSAVENKVHSENLTKVLYPSDIVFQGKELRLKQEYFFVSCSIQDILRRFKADGNPWSAFPDKVFVQLNDTHPALLVPELMRLLIDCEGLHWDQAWEITTKSTGYTNHTILPEALEKWPMSMIQNLLPRHLLILFEINARFMREVAIRYPLDTDRLRRMSIFEEGGDKNVRMAHVAIVGSCSVNGVAALHTHLLKERVLRDFAEFWPEKFNNKTNGITPRRWLLKANPPLAELITSSIGDGWITDLGQLRQLEPLADNAAFRKKFRAAKQQNKVALAQFIEQTMGVSVSPDAMFDVQVKRLHEYKRQLLLVLFAIVRYMRIKHDPQLDVPARVILFAAKAAPGYFMAKLIIKLINAVGNVINRDPAVNGKLKVLFLPNYRVSLAERIIPAADLSEQISLAGTEASGTGNMKLQLNGALTIGTLDGANVEIREQVGDENMFVFGMTTEEVEQRRTTYNPWDIYGSDPEIRGALELIQKDFFSMLEPGIFKPLIDSLLEHGDRYMLLADMRNYIETQERVDACFVNKTDWDRKSILNVARAGHFSSDRTVLEYTREIWNVKPVEVGDAAPPEPRVRS
ncbi:MAG: glycogen/starch/alpha-glucan phosphorylase [Verrucomicrobia bacterium]|nr:glycogen/starch/alpha-glucan phosphorylase [Verrucomicrobiota bacterium]